MNVSAKNAISRKTRKTVLFNPQPILAIQIIHANSESNLELRNGCAQKINAMVLPPVEKENLALTFIRKWTEENHPFWIKYWHFYTRFKQNILRKYNRTLPTYIQVVRRLERGKTDIDFSQKAPLQAFPYMNLCRKPSYS